MHPKLSPLPQGFNIHVNGTLHCCLRYKQLHSLHEQLKRSLPNLILPHFPSKKLFPLTTGQLEDRRAHLERYIQLSETNYRALTFPNNNFISSFISTLSL